ncbi:MAG: dTDP-4-dehydrorhamnose reductase, partial [Proteobacteria bacterium]|nr:dTDP-4-dehydrorhamnose reductase [Pseudomonadota bacterium]
MLVFGSTGQVASALKMTLADQGAVFLDRGACDLGSPAAVQAALERYQPRFIINAAAYTAVDRAEEEPELAYAINAVAPRIMAEYVASVSSGGRLNPPPSSLIHISTDFVFNGTRTTPYRPGDPTDPLGAYGASKLAGELNILDAAPERSMIIRTAWVYHEEGGNFVKTMLRLMGERNELGVVNDQRGSPTYAASIADAITTIIQQDLFTPGIYHWT